MKRGNIRPINEMEDKLLQHFQEQVKALAKTLDYEPGEGPQPPILSRKIAWVRKIISDIGLEKTDGGWVCVEPLDIIQMPYPDELLPACKADMEYIRGIFTRSKNKES